LVKKQRIRKNQSQMEALCDGQREAAKQNFHLIKVCGITLLKADMEVLQALQIRDFGSRKCITMRIQ
jgi:hypothetical protein